MGKKQYQSSNKYARTGSKAKKRRPQKPAGQMSTFSALPEQSPAGEVPPSLPPHASAVQARQLQATIASHTYVVSDLIHTLIIAVIAFIILVILYFVL